MGRVCHDLLPENGTTTQVQRPILTENLPTRTSSNETPGDHAPNVDEASLPGSTSKTSDEEIPDTETRRSGDSIEYNGLIPDKRPLEPPRRNASTTENLPFTVEVVLQEHPADDDASLSRLRPAAPLFPDGDKMEYSHGNEYVGLIPDKTQFTTPVQDVFHDLPISVEAETPHEDAQTMDQYSLA